MRLSQDVYLSVSYFLLWSVVGFFYPYFPLFLASLGLDGTQIGIALGILPLHTIFTPLIWGYLADRTKRRTELYVLALAGGLLANVAFLFIPSSFGIVITAMFVVGAFLPALGPMLDAITLAYVKQTGKDFGHIRHWGAFGFVASSLLMGWIIRQTHVLAMFYGLILLLAIQIPLGFTLPKIESDGQGLRSKDTIELIRDRRVLWFLGFCFLYGIGYSSYLVGYTLFLRDLRLPTNLIGAAWAFGGVTEIVLIYFSVRLYKKVGAFNMLLLCVLATMTRWTAHLFIDGVVPVFAVQALHAFTFGGFLVASQLLITEIIKPELKSTGQALFFAVFIGVGGVIGHALFGRLLDLFGTRQQFGFAAGVLVVSLLPLLVFRLYDRHRYRPATVA
ncbi:MAG: MFS transporter [Acidobacteriota bacterium]|nr:MFS transporter [Acidobacteriota bacterium]